MNTRKNLYLTTATFLAMGCGAQAPTDIAEPVAQERAALLVSERDLGQIGLYVILLIPLAAALVGYAVYRSRRTS